MTFAGCGDHWSEKNRSLMQKSALTGEIQADKSDPMPKDTLTGKNAALKLTMATNNHTHRTKRNLNCKTQKL